MRTVVCNARAARRPELGGVERWAREAIPRLAALDPAYRPVSPPAALVHRAGHAWEQLVLPLRARQLGARLLFSPANLAPLAWPDNVVVIHDAAALRGAGWYSDAYVAWQRRLLPVIARRARHVVTVSDFSRREIVELLGTPPERVSVIAGGVDGRFSPAADPEPARRALGLSRPYVLTVGSTTARKNLGALDSAARRLAGEGIELLAAGGARPQFRPGEAGGGSPAVRSVGYVADELLPGLYAGARAFVLASLYEGFGLTCVEAMAAGVPVVAADRGALPETCAGAALLVDPLDEQALADAVLSLATEEPRRARLRTAGLARAGELTWERTAGELDRLLRSLNR